MHHLFHAINLHHNNILTDLQLSFLWFCNLPLACMFESKWKSFSRKLPRKKEVEDTGIGADDGAGSLHLLKHREAALNRVKGCVDCSHLDIEWHQDPS